MSRVFTTIISHLTSMYAWQELYMVEFIIIVLNLI